MQFLDRRQSAGDQSRTMQYMQSCSVHCTTVYCELAELSELSMLYYMYILHYTAIHCYMESHGAG